MVGVENQCLGNMEETKQIWLIWWYTWEQDVFASHIRGDQLLSTLYTHYLKRQSHNIDLALFDMT